MIRRWTINGRFLTQPLTGVQRYAREVVSALDALLASGGDFARSVEVELLYPPETTDVLNLEMIGTRSVGRFKGHLWEQYCLPRSVDGGLLSFCNTGPLAVRKQIVCIHDVNTRLYPASYSRSFRTLYRCLIPALGRVAERVSTVSHYSRGELARLGIAPAGKIFVAANGHEHALRWQPKRAHPSPDTPWQNTIALIGSPAPHKNAAMIIGLADRLAEAGIGIAVVGMRDGRVFKTGPRQVAAGNVTWLGRLDDDEMAALLQDCLCLVFPSFVEGFGLPPLEAMAIGCPVIASDRASLPEICMDAALYASPENPDAWLDRIRRLSQSPALRAEMIARGHKVAANYRWRRTAERYLTAMAEMDGILEGESRPA